MYDPDRAAHNLAPPFEHIVDVVGRSHGVYHVIDAHMCPYKGRNYAHVVIRGDGQTLSLFAERAERGALPDTPTTVLRRRRARRSRDDAIGLSDIGGGDARPPALFRFRTADRPARPLAGHPSFGRALHSRSGEVSFSTRTARHRLTLGDHTGVIFSYAAPPADWILCSSTHFHQCCVGSR